MVSMVIHTGLLLALAVLSLAPKVNQTLELVVGNSVDTSELDDFDLTEAPDIEIDAIEMVEIPEVDLVEDITENFSEDVLVEDFAPTEAASEFEPSVQDLMTVVEAAPGESEGSFKEGFKGRGESSKAELLRRFGGTKGSEEAVKRALEWLKNHQLRDGGWNFDHTLSDSCDNQCDHVGTLRVGRTGATGLALLPFLGAGYTHTSGPYQKEVQRGLYFLTNEMDAVGKRGDLSGGGGGLYSHGLCAIVLCEAYAMTKDRDLKEPAQMAINHIVFAQDPQGGGWRYSPRQRGDTSVVGWQLMALKSGHMAYLRVPKQTVIDASRFLDSMQSNRGANYGYTRPGAGEATTAVGLLSRMYLGWKRDHEGIRRGVRYLSNEGPSRFNMYYNYYATQVMKQYDGDMWKRWNKQMRDYLIDTQSKTGHTTGSWYFDGDHGSHQGGRLYCTSMATMILEVYYRHMPIYDKRASDDDFPL